MLHCLPLNTGYSCHNLGGEIWGQPRTIKRVLNIGCDSDMSVCFGIWMVMGSIRVDCTKWDIPTGNQVCRPEHYGCCKSPLHIHHCSVFSSHALPFQVRDLLVLCIVDHGNDHLRLLFLTGNQGSSNWRNYISVEKTLVLEEDYTWISPSWWQSQCLEKLKKELHGTCLLCLCCISN